MRLDTSLKRLKATFLYSSGNRTVQTFLYSGPGLANFEKEEAILEVRYKEGTKQFDCIAPAVIFYINLKTDASIWDITGTPMLIESKIMVPV